MSDKVLLSEVLAEISCELQKAHDRAKNDGWATMQFEECEIEFAVKAEKDHKGGLKVWLLDIGGSLKKTETNTVKMKFKKHEDNVIQASSTDLVSAGPKIERQ